jgi:hypothetical protein
MDNHTDAAPVTGSRTRPMFAAGLAALGVARLGRRRSR